MYITVESAQIFTIFLESLFAKLNLNKSVCLLLAVIEFAKSRI